MTPPPDDLPPDLAAFVHAERRRPPLDDEHVETILRAARARVAGGPGGAEPEGGGAAPPAAPAAATSFTPIVTAIVGFAAGVFFHAFLTYPDTSEGPATLPVVSGATLADPTVEAADAIARDDRTPGNDTTDEPRLPTRPADPPVSAPTVLPASPASTPTAPPVLALPTSPDVTAPLSRRSDESVGTPSLADQLAAERRLIDVARAAIASGTPAVALESVELHRTRHEHGILCEERDALEIDALMLNGDTDRARLALARFEANYPHSVHAARLSALFSPER